MKTELINTAIEQLQEIEGINVKRKTNKLVDGELTIDFNGVKINYVVFARKELRQYQLDEIFNIQRENNKGLLVIAENIFPKIKDKLNENNIAYIEIYGNTRLIGNGTYVFIEKNKKRPNRRIKTYRTFTKTGLIVVFHFLMDKELVNKTHREIAKTAGVALGNIPQVIDGLKAMGYLLPLNKTDYVWDKRDELLDRWVNEYGTTLRPKLYQGNYVLKENWTTLQLKTDVAVWGGEPAADILTNHLRPEKFMLYTKERQIEFMKKYRLIPKAEGELEVLDMFWNNTTDDKTAPPILVYADLLLEGGKRNYETARLIFDEYIKQNL